MNKAWGQQDSVSWTEKMPKHLIGTDLSRLVMLINEQYEVSFTFQKQIKNGFYTYTKVGYVNASQCNKLVNLEKSKSSGAYLKTGVDYQVFNKKVGYNIGLAYIFSYSQETNDWAFQTSYWQPNYVYRHQIQMPNHGLGLFGGIKYRVNPKFILSFKTSLNFRFGHWTVDDHKRFFAPGFGYDFRYEYFYSNRRRPYEQLISVGFSFSAVIPF